MGHLRLACWRCVRCWLLGCQCEDTLGEQQLVPQDLDTKGLEYQRVNRGQHTLASSVGDGCSSDLSETAKFPLEGPQVRHQRALPGVKLQQPSGEVVRSLVDVLSLIFAAPASLTRPTPSSPPATATSRSAVASDLLAAKTHTGAASAAAAAATLALSLYRHPVWAERPTRWA